MDELIEIKGTTNLAKIFKLTKRIDFALCMTTGKEWVHRPFRCHVTILRLFGFNFYL